MAAACPHFTHSAGGSGVLSHPWVREWICSLLALRRCQHLVSQQGHLRAGRMSPQCSESPVALPELLTWHLEKARALRVSSGDQSTEEMTAAFRLLWVSSQWPTFLCIQKPPLLLPACDTPITTPLLVPTFPSPVSLQLGCAEGLNTTAAWTAGGNLGEQHSKGREC